MTIIGLINQKGGVSKSTTSIHLAYWLSVKKKKKVLLVDADSQKSSSQWIDGMDQQIPVSILQSPDEILEQLPDLSRNYEYVIVDGPASLSEATRAILFRCDVAVIPTQPTGVDLRSASDAMRLVKQAQSVRGGLPKALIFLSRAVKGTKLKEEAISLLSQIPDSQFLKAKLDHKSL